METLTLNAAKREEIGNRRPERLRVNASIPAVIYGSDVKSTSIAVNDREFSRVYRAAGESTLVDLVIDNAKPVKVLIQDLQRDVMRGDVIHVDFFQVNMNKEIDAEIKLKLVGEAPAVRELGGTLIQTLEELNVRCLPGALVHEIEVDVTGLKTFEDAVHVSDLVIPEGMRVTNEPEESVVIVEEPRSEDELAKLNEVVATYVTQVEVEKKGKEETEEGATPAAEAK